MYRIILLACLISSSFAESNLVDLDSLLPDYHEQTLFIEAVADHAFNTFPWAMMKDPKVPDPVPDSGIRAVLYGPNIVFGKNGPPNIKYYTLLFPPSQRASSSGDMYIRIHEIHKTPEGFEVNYLFGSSFRWQSGNTNMSVFKLGDNFRCKSGILID